VTMVDYYNSNFTSILILIKTTFRRLEYVSVLRYSALLCPVDRAKPYFRTTVVVKVMAKKNCNAVRSPLKLRETVTYWLPAGTA
jgi:hypothetical protein